MFFWGGYSFSLPQQQEQEEKPALRYPIHVPPTPSYLSRQGIYAGAQALPDRQLNSGNTTLAAHKDVADSEGPARDPLLNAVLGNQLRVLTAAAGFKHAVIVVERATSTPAPSVFTSAARARTEQEEKLSISTATAAADVSGTDTHTMSPSPSNALAASGTSTERQTLVYGLGSNHLGQLGHAVATYTNTLTDLKADSIMEGSIVSVAAGLRHTLLATSRGCVYVTGDNACGQLGLSAASLTAAARARGSGGGDGEGGGGASGAAAAATATAAAAAAAVLRFTQVSSLAHVARVFAAHNSSFALDARGAAYSWGDAQYGHLGHGGDHIVADPRGGLDRVENVRQPRKIQWFDRHRVTITDIAVGRSHAVFLSADGDVYTCGEGAFGKLGHGSIDPELEPRRLNTFPPRKQKEKTLSIAAGDDCTLVLRENPVVGSVVYFCGKLSNGDGQLTPVIIPLPFRNLPMPSAPRGAAQQQQQQPPLLLLSEDSMVALRSVHCGRGNQCLAVSHDGRLFVWGKHSYQKLYNGTPASAARTQPTAVEALEKFVVDGVAVGGTLAVAWATRLRHSPTPEDAHRLKEESTATTADDDGDSQQQRRGSRAGSLKRERAPTTDSADASREWDVVVPHDARASAADDGGDAANLYEAGQRAFLTQYFGPLYGKLSAAYIAGMPVAPPRTSRRRYAFTALRTSAITEGQKVRLWMTDLYALGTVTRTDAEDRDNLVGQPASAPRRPSPQPLSQHRTSCRTPPRPSPPSSQAARVSPAPLAGAASPPERDADSGAPVCSRAGGRRVLIEWQRDDWRDEVVTLYSDDETLDESNDNRWQPFWFEKDVDTDEYVIAKSR